MPKVPERKLSYGEEQEKLRKLQKGKDTPGTKNFPKYTFKESPKGSRHGAVKTTIASTLPHPFKCSKCDYIATSASDKNAHWLNEH